jgi:hypothetical protein
MIRTADISPCGRYRSKLGRTWDAALPVLLVVMYGPSTADGQVNDPTITLLSHIAAHNGFGGIVVVNGIPLRTPDPVEQAWMVNTWDVRAAWDERDRLQDNVAVVRREVAKAGAVLLAWGALADRCPAWFDSLQEQIREELPAGVPLYCLGKTAAGYPLHPMARGKRKVPKDAALLLWGAPACAT